MPPEARPGVSSTPHQISARQAVTAIAGSIRSVVIESLSTSRPEVSAATITDTSSAPTRIAAARRVSSDWRPLPAVRR